MKTRFYVHGDLIEDGYYYCVGCDLRVSRDHFHTSDCLRNVKKENHYQRYLRHLKFWNKVKKDALKDFMRPDLPPNILR